MLKLQSFSFPPKYVIFLVFLINRCCKQLLVRATTKHASNCITVNITKERLCRGIPSCPSHKIGRAYGKYVVAWFKDLLRYGRNTQIVHYEVWGTQKNPLGLNTLKSSKVDQSPFFYLNKICFKKF